MRRLLGFCSLGFVAALAIYLASPLNTGAKDRVRNLAAMVLTGIGTTLGAAVFLHRELTRWALAEGLLKREARLDRLTQLANRTALEEALEQEIAAAVRYSRRFGVVFIDLDGLKEANDSFGHDAGDRLLIEAGLRLKRALRKEDVAARLSGDEFAIITKEVRTPEDAVSVGRRIAAALGQPFQDRVQVLPMSASVGVAVFPIHGRTAFGLLKAADRAMYSAKAAGGNSYSIAHVSALPEAGHAKRA
ncbi:GGDEF domain-containing protein [Caenispirillum salinarum]|uniref:GGDEF domain-containing protein n=1 Tax=Caenispirillum salinarum TaxID=859058 RepID=UPI0009FECE8E|nr:GGDEF domain-containing protein [Caenispirillum salinarum]